MEEIEKAYHNPSTGYVGRRQLYAQLKKSHGIDAPTHKQIESFFKKDNTAQVFQKIDKKPSLAPIMVDEPFELWELDLIDYSQTENTDGGFKYIMVVIDDFTKYVWAVPMASKDTAHFSNALHGILSKARKLPKTIMSDGEAAMKSDDVQKMLRVNNIKWVNRGNTHAPTVERTIRTIKDKLERYFIDRDNRKWVKVLPKIIENINNTVSSTTGFAPNEALDNIEAVRWNLTIYYHQAFANIPINKVSVGDEVRIVIKNFLQKGSKPKWTSKKYKVLAKKGSVLTLEDYEGRPVRTNEVLKV